jgi:hypothetical protein
MRLTVDRWSAASERERMQLAEALLRQLPQGFSLLGVRDHVLGAAHGRVATYIQYGREFSLVPGGTFTVGWIPDPDDDNEDLEDDTLADLERTVRGSRTIVVPPLLVETEAIELGWEPADPSDRQVKEAIAALAKQSSRALTMHAGGATIDVRRREDGTIAARRATRGVTHARHTATLANTGFRLPTSDEWEYLCGAGATTLFRWGEAAPRTHYPTNASPDEAQWRRDWVMSSGTLEPPHGGFAQVFDLHRRPNVLGLLIATDPYRTELVAEADQLRGGDGGCRICGGHEFFAGWLPLATAFFDEELCRRDPADEIQVGYTFARRVLPVG